MDDLPLYLVIEASSDRALVGRKFALDSLPPVVTVGRDRACTLEIQSQAVSSRHARFERTTSGWRVVDDGSTHGTYVNDVRVREAQLRQDDRVQLGDTLFTIAAYIVRPQYKPTALDPMTQLPNKRSVLEYLDATVRSAAGRLALVRIDVDKMRAVNDERGHQGGDQALIDLAARLVADLRPGEFAGRLGADDFVLVLPATELPRAKARATEIRAKLAAVVSVSVGAAVAEPQHRGGDDLIYAAEKDLWDGRRVR
jgi:diguanylate cyclase (GGDEF)-like protein